MQKEKDFGHGVIRRNPLVKTLQKLWRQANGQKIGKSGTVDWLKGFDVRDTIGSIQIKDQGQNNSCGGQAGSYFLEIQERLRNIKEGAISAKSIYSPWRNIGGGMTVTQLNTQIGAHGANLEVTVPSYYANGDPLPEYLMTEQSWKTPTALKDAMTRAGYTPYDVAEDITTVAQTIQNYGACLIELRGNNNSTWLSPTPSIVHITDYWYHYLCFIGFKMMGNNKYLIALNSWGDIGNHGVQYFGEEWFTHGNVIDAFTWIHDSQITVSTNVPVSQETIWQALNRWFRSIWLSEAVKTA